MQRRDFLGWLAGILSLPALLRFLRRDDAMLAAYEETERIASYSATILPNYHTTLRSAGIEGAPSDVAERWTYTPVDYSETDDLIFEFR